LALAGCQVGPDYQRPAPLGTNSLPPAFSGPANTLTNVQWQPAAPAANRPRGAWWELFHDPELARLEVLAGANNQQLAVALARYDEARAAVKVARADLLPQVEADPSYVRQRSSYYLPSNGRAAGVAPTFNTFNVALESGWEADLWGRVRRAVEAARASLAASAQDLEAVKLALQAELAMDYFTARALEAEDALLQRTIVAYRLSLDLTLNRRQGGIASDLDVSQAQTQLRTAEAALPALRLRRARLVHAIGALCGQPATGFALPPRAAAAGAAAAEAPQIPAGLPSQLLERRPDIAAAEQRVGAANAQIGVALGAFYPHLRFTGLGGFESVSAGTWFQAASGQWAVGPAVQLPLFTGGRNRAQLAQARAAHAEAVASYRQTVLSAFQEVEDALAAQAWLKEQLEAEQAALASAQHTLDVANNRYKSGLVTYLEVATAQSAALAVEQTVVQLRGDRLVAAVGLIKALGGGWREKE
jgi:multidrug efflux system outer membrane protein